MKGYKLTGMLVGCLLGAGCEGQEGPSTTGVQGDINVAPATLQQAQGEIERGNQLLANGADRPRILAEMVQVRDQMDQLDGLIDHIPLGTDHVVSFYLTQSNALVVSERAPKGTSSALAGLDLAHLSAAELHLRLAPDQVVPQALLDSPMGTQVALGGGEVVASQAGAQGSDSSSAIVDRTNQDPDLANVRSALTGADGAFFRNTYCPSVGVYFFCLPNWGGGAFAQASATHSHVTIAPYAGGGAVLTSVAVNGSTLGSWANFDGEVATYMARSGHHQVNDHSCCFICACPNHTETATQGHRWDISAAGQSFHFGGYFLSDPRFLGLE
jgi:hypothetical protein